MRSTIPAMLAMTLSFAACDGGAPPTGDAAVPDAGDAGTEPYPAHCENVGPAHCLLPWPSSFFLARDRSTRTGYRIELPEAAMPLNNRRRPVDPTQFSRFDGFSPATSIMTVLDGDVDPSNLADERHIDDSLAPDSPTVIVDAASGERVAHFAEIDTWPHIDPARRPLYLRPATRLRENRRYLVAIRNLRRPGGDPIEAPPYFRALREGQPLPEASDIESRRAHFEEIFAMLEAAGVERGTLIQAWDFHTASGESLWGEIVAMRDEMLRAIEADSGPRCTVRRVLDPREPDPEGFFGIEPEIWRIVEGTVRVPLFLNGTDPNDFEQSRLHRGAGGAPERNGFADVPFVVKIPVSVHDDIAAGGPPARLLDYGHGLFGDRFETNASWFRQHIAQTRMVSVAIDWWGMSTDDLARVLLTLQDFSGFVSLAERMQQGLLNHVALHRSFRGACAALPELQIPRTAGGSAPAIDTTQTYYYGNSQGGIYGLSVAGLAVDVTRLVSGVGGMTYSLMIPRSTNWSFYDGFMQMGYRDSMIRALLMVMSQSLWDLVDPATYVPHITRDPLPCASDVCPSGSTPIHQILMQIGRDDAQVPNISADLAARTAGIGYASPAIYTPWNVPPLTAPLGEVLGDSALVIYDIAGVPMLPLGTRDPMGDNDAHEGVRRAPSAIEQIDRFHRPDGRVIQTCDGICRHDIR